MHNILPSIRVLFVRRLKSVVFIGVMLAVCGALIAQVSSTAYAATSSTLNFQARLHTSAGGIVPDGYYNIEFKIYDAASSIGSSQGSCTGDVDCLWTETRYDSNGVTAGNDNRVRVKNGYLTVNLGSVTAFPGGIPWDQELWITMRVGGSTQTATPTYDPEMSPRLQLTGVPYAFKAGDSATLGGIASSGFIQNTSSPQTANFNITGNGTIGGTLTVSGNITGNGTTNLIKPGTDTTSAFQVQSSASVVPVLGVDTLNRRVGIGIAAPGGDLHLYGSGALGSNAVIFFGDRSTASNPYIRESGTGDSDIIEIGGRAGLSLRTGTSGSYGIERLGIDASGSITAGGTYNTNTFTSNALTFGAAGAATISSAASQPLTVSAGTDLTLSAAATQSVLIGTVNSNTITLGTTTATSTITVGRSTNSNTINIGNGNTTTTNTQTINIGAGTASGTGKAMVTIGNTNAASGVVLNSGTAGIALNGDVTGSATIRANTAFNINGTAGLSLAACTGGQLLQNAAITGGIVTAGSCVAPGGGGGVTTVGTIDSQAKSLNGAVISGTNIYMQTADGANLGLVSTGTQSFAGFKTFNDGINLASGNTYMIGGSNILSSSDLTFSTAGAAGVRSASGSVLTVDSGSTAALNLGTGANAKTITIGNATGATSLVLNSGTGGVSVGNNAVNKTINIGATGATANTTSVLAATSTGAAQTVQVGGTYASGGSNASSMVSLQGGATGVQVSNTGAIVRNFTNSTTGFQVQNSTGGAIVIADTTNNALVLGTGDGTATPGSFTVRGAAAAGSNIAGATMFFDAANGTGSAGSGDLVFRTARVISLQPVYVGASSNESIAATTNSDVFDAGSASNRVLIVNVTASSTTATRTVSSITYNGVALTLLSASNCATSGTNFCRGETWYLKNPAAGTNTLVTTVSATADIAVGSAIFSNVDQTTPFGTVATASGNGTTSGVTVTGTNTDQIVFDFLSSFGKSAINSWGATEIFDINGGNDGAAGAYKAGSATNTVTSWTLITTSNWVERAFAINGLSPTTVNPMTEVARITNNGDLEIAAASTLEVFGFGAFRATSENVAAFNSITSGDTTLTIGSSDGNPGEKYVTYRNITTGSNAWMVGMDDDETFGWDYGTAGEISTRMMTLDQSGNLGIGPDQLPNYRLDVDDSQATNYVTRIRNTNTANTADGLLIDLGVANASRATGNYFVGFSAAGTVSGKIQGCANAVACTGGGTGPGVSYTTTGADYAEWFRAPSSDMPGASELVQIDVLQDGGVVRAGSNGQTNIVGIVSTNAGFVGNGPLCIEGDEDCDSNYAKYNALIALTGQVSVKVNNSKGAINIGDPITVSTVAGQGAKASTAGYIVGYAQEELVGDSGTVKVLVRPQYYTPPATAETENRLNELQAQVDGIGTFLNTGDIRTVSMTVTGDANIQGDLSVTGIARIGELHIGGHLITVGEAPVVALLPAAGQGNVAKVEVSGNDTAGVITVTIGDTPAGDALVRLTFNKPFKAEPRIVLTPVGKPSAGLQPYVDAPKVNEFVLGVSTAPQTGQTYKFNYLVIQ